MALLGLNTLILLVTALVLLYFYLVRNFNYWKKLGIQGPMPIPYFGTLHQIFGKSLNELNKENSKKYGKIFGVYYGDQPVLTIADPVLIKDMIIRDFNVFTDRNGLVSGDYIFDRSPLNLMGDDWKRMRSIVSPTFSSGKMRRMHPIIVDCVKRLVTVLERRIKEKGLKEIDAKCLMSSLTMDVIASAAFSVRLDTYSEDHVSVIVANAEKASSGTWRFWFTFIMAFVSPKIFRLIHFSAIEPKIKAFFKTTVRSIVSRRQSEQSKENRTDYLQIITDAMNKCTCSDNVQEVKDDNSDYKIRPKAEVTERDVLATSVVFFVNGFAATATTLSNLFYELATNEKVQQRLYEELEKYGPDFDYETIGRMPYLDACISEILRLYNPIAALPRFAAQDYTVGNTGLTVPKGMMVNFDITSVHHNPEYYPDPLTYNPDRFLPENKDKLVPYTYMPFALGPRNCPGMRFALMEIKTAVTHLITNYRFFATDKTPTELKPKKFDFLFNAGNVYIGIEPRK